MSKPITTLPDRVTVLIIGAGPGGLCAGIKLAQAGITDFVILEKASGVGGTWWHNRYPGAECDVQSHLYSFSFAPKVDWSRPYAGQAEIRAYVEQVADKYGMLPYCRFNQAVTALRWVDKDGHWDVQTADGHRLTARFVISGIGMFNEITQPDIPGLDDFAGTLFHTARWQDNHDLAGERVALLREIEVEARDGGGRRALPGALADRGHREVKAEGLLEEALNAIPHPREVAIDVAGDGGGRALGDGHTGLR